MVTRRTLETSTTSHLFTFNLARKCHERRYTSIFSSPLAARAHIDFSHVTFSCQIIKHFEQKIYMFLFTRQFLWNLSQSTTSLAALRLINGNVNAGFPSTLHTVHQPLEQLCHVTRKLLEMTLFLTVRLGLIHSSVMDIPDLKQN